jgi:hypothetical protein
MKRVALIVTLVMVALFAFPATSFAGGLLQGRVVFGDSFTLESGETLDGDLLVFGGDVNLEPESRVLGDVVVFGGNVTSDGLVSGDLVIVGGNVRLGSSAKVENDLVTIGGNLSESPGAEVGGQYISETEFSFPFDFDWRAPRIFPVRIQTGGAPFQVAWYLFRSFVLAALAVLVVLFLAEPTKRISSAIVSQPLLAGGMGLLTIVLLPIALILMVITILLLPAVPLLLLILVVAVVFGWIAIGLEVGKRIAEGFKWELHPAGYAGLGTLLVSLVVGGIDFIPCVGWLASLFVILLGLGGVLLTRFGTQQYTFVPAASGANMVEKAEEE